MTRTFSSARIASRVFAASLVMLIAGCGGGGGSAGTPGNPIGVTSASLTLVIPPATTQSIARKTNYISPNTASIQINIDNVNGSPNVPGGVPASTTVKLTSGAGQPCTTPNAQGSTCTISFPAPAGNIVFSFTIMDAKGQPLATAKKEFTIIKGEANSNLQVVLGGIVATVTIGPVVLVGGVSSVTTLVVNAYDASGALIDASAPYATPIVLSDTDTAPLSTHLEVRNGTGPTAQINTASDVVTLSYNGNPLLPAFKLNATVGSTLVGSITVAPTTNAISFSNTSLGTGTVTQPNPPNLNQPTLYFGSVGTPSAPVTRTTTPSEGGYAGSYTAALNSTTCTTVVNNVQVPVASISPTTTTTDFTVTALNPGLCEVVVQDTANHQSVFWIDVTTGVVGINARSRQLVK